MLRTAGTICRTLKDYEFCSLRFLNCQINMLKTNDPSVDNLYSKSHSSLLWGFSFVTCAWTRFAQSLSISFFDAADKEEISAAHFQPKFSKAFRQHATSSYFVYATFFCPFLSLVPPPRDSTIAVAIGASVGGALALLILSMVIIKCLRRHRKQELISEEKMEEEGKLEAEGVAEEGTK